MTALLTASPDTLKISDISRIVRLLEKAASEDSADFYPSLRSVAVIVFPLAVRDSRYWTEPEILRACGEALKVFSQALRELTGLNQRFQVASERVIQRVTSEVIYAAD